MDSKLKSSKEVGTVGNEATDRRKAAASASSSASKFDMFSLMSAQSRFDKQKSSRTLKNTHTRTCEKMRITNETNKQTQKRVFSTR